MRLYIRLLNNEKPWGSPILESNLKELYPDISVKNIPEGFARFVKPPMLVLNQDEKIVTTYYVWKDGYVTEKYTIGKAV